MRRSEEKYVAKMTDVSLLHTRLTICDYIASVAKIFVVCIVVDLFYFRKIDKLIR